MRALQRPLTVVVATAALLAPATTGWAADRAPSTVREYVGATLQTYVHGTLLYLQVKDFGSHTEVRGQHEDSVRNVSSTSYNIGTDTDGDRRFEPAILPGGVLTLDKKLTSGSYLLQDVPVHKVHREFAQYTYEPFALVSPGSTTTSEERLTFSGAFTAGADHKVFKDGYRYGDSSTDTCTVEEDRVAYTDATVSGFFHDTTVTAVQEEARVFLGTETTGPC